MSLTTDNISKLKCKVSRLQDTIAMLKRELDTNKVSYANYVKQIQESLELHHEISPLTFLTTMVEMFECMNPDCNSKNKNGFIAIKLDPVKYCPFCGKENTVRSIREQEGD